MYLIHNDEVLGVGKGWHDAGNCGQVIGVYDGLSSAHEFGESLLQVLLWAQAVGREAQNRREGLVGLAT